MKPFQKLREAEAKATEGPWYADIGNRQVETHSHKYHRGGICMFDYNSRNDPNIPAPNTDECNDGEFIALSRNQLKDVLQALDLAVEALNKYRVTFETIEAQINLNPSMFKVWARQMEFLLEDAPKALEQIKNLGG